MAMRSLLFCTIALVVLFTVADSREQSELRMARKFSVHSIELTNRIGYNEFTPLTPYCVAKDGASSDELRSAIRYVCIKGSVDCGALKQRPCFSAQYALESYASAVFDAYFKSDKALGPQESLCTEGPLKNVAEITFKDPCGPVNRN